jgi:hypothetical protein
MRLLRAHRAFVDEELEEEQEEEEEEEQEQRGNEPQQPDHFENVNI